MIKRRRIKKWKNPIKGRERGDLRWFIDLRTKPKTRKNLKIWPQMRMI